MKNKNKNKNTENKSQKEKNNLNREEENDTPDKLDAERSQNMKEETSEKMTIKIDEKINQELLKEEKKPKIKIFNNKKNNDICSELLKSTIDKEKELIIIPYAKEKQKINKTLNTIGNAHGISYPTCSVIKGIQNPDKNYLSIIRTDDKKGNKKKKKNNFNSNTKNSKKEFKAEIYLDSNNNDILDNNNLKEMLGNAKNIQEFI